MNSNALENWQSLKFEEILHVRKERALNDGNFPLFSLTIADGVAPKSARYEREFLVSNTDTKTYKIVHENDLVFNPANLRWGAIARAKISRSVLVSPIYEILYPKDLNVLCPIFLEYLAKSDHLHLEYLHYMEGTLVERTALKIDDFLNLKVKIPPLPEQKKIASILTSVDEVIESTQKQIDKLQDLKKATMNELLTKGIGHTEFRDSELGRIPKSWEVKPVSEICLDIIDCVNKTAPIVDYKTSYKMLRTTNVRDGEIDTENVRYVTKDTFDIWTRRGALRKNDIIFTREAPVGETGIVDEPEGLFLGQRTMMYRVHPLKTNPKFLLFAFQSEYCKKQLEDMTGGSTVGHMRVPDCSKILFAHCPKTEQDKIASIIFSQNRNITALKRKLSQTQSLKKSLMQDLLTGKVRVKVN